jgi:hypothetical protein
MKNLKPQVARELQQPQRFTKGLKIKLTVVAFSVL